MNKVMIRQEKDMDYRTREAVRTLCVSLMNSYGFDNTAAFTSYMGKEGKTFIAWNMACAIASTGKSCIYVNANLRGKTASDIYETEQINNTLAAYLRGECKKSEIIYATNKENFYIIESGAPCENAAELIDTELFVTLFEEIRNEFEYVMIDTPALGEVSDALVACREADGVVIVMERGMVSYEQAQKMKKKIESNKCRVIGVVLNK